MPCYGNNYSDINTSRPTFISPKNTGHKHMCSGNPNTQPNVRSIHPEEVIRQVYTLFTGGKNLRKGATFACP